MPTYTSPFDSSQQVDETTYNNLKQDFDATQNQKPSTEVSSISSKDAVSQVNKQKGYLDTTYPQTPLPSPTGTQASTQTSTQTTPEAQGKAYFTNQAGQEAEYTQEQLNDPATKQFLTDNGYVMVKSDGVNVGSDFSTSKTQTGLNEASAQVENLTKDFLNYNVDQDPDFQAQSASIKANFDKLQRQMEKTNYQRAQGLSTLGMRSGTTQYADAIQTGIEGAELTQANQRISDIVAEEASTISAARSAFKNNKFTEFNNKVTALKDLRDQKQKELENYNTAIANYTKKLQEEEDIAKKQTIQSSRDGAIASLVQQGVTDPSEMLNFLNYDDSGKQIGDFTLEEVSKAMNFAVNKEALAGLDADFRTYQYLKQTQPSELESMGVNSYQSYLKSVNSAKNDFVGDLMSKYPDAGISPNDDYATAQSKLQSSKIYQQATRLTKGGTSSGGGSGGGFGGVGSSSGDLTDYDILAEAVSNKLGSVASKKSFDEQYAKAKTDEQKIRILAANAVLPAEIKNGVIQNTQVTTALDSVLKMLDSGVKTGLLEAGQSYIANKLGSGGDKEIEAIKSKLIAAIQPYRNKVTGAAWGPQEEAEYQALIGSVRFSPEDLSNKLNVFKDTLKQQSQSALLAGIDPLGAINQDSAFKESPSFDTLNTTQQYNLDSSGVEETPEIQQGFWSGVKNWLFGD